jgi:DNA-binding transcriptional LysR family regulator
METNRIRQFRIIVETGNLRKAADLLGISHSGLSKSMKALEAELGFALFQPSGRGIVVSDQGLRVYDASNNLLNEVDRLLGAVKNSEKTILRIGSFEVFTTHFIGPLLKTYLPHVEVEIHELVPGRLEEALAFNRVDIGITYEPVPRKAVDYVKISNILMGAYGLKGQFKGLELSEIPFIVPVSPLEGAPSGVKGRDGWPDEKIKRNIKFKVDLMSTGLEIARQGLGAIFIPRFVANLHNELVNTSHRLEALHLPKNLGQVRREVFIVRRESSVETHEVRQLAKALRNICQQDRTQEEN